MYIYTNMKGAFVHAWGEMGLTLAHVKLSRAHVIAIKGEQLVCVNLLK